MPETTRKPGGEFGLQKGHVGIVDALTDRISVDDLADEIQLIITGKDSGGNKVKVDDVPRAKLDMLKQMFDAFSKLVGVDIYQRPINAIQAKATG